MRAAAAADDTFSLGDLLTPEQRHYKHKDPPALREALELQIKLARVRKLKTFCGANLRRGLISEVISRSHLL